MPVIREESENFFEATIPNQPPVLLCSAVCAVVYTDRHPEVTRLDVFDYQRRTLVPAQTAFHLYESKLEVRAAMPPSRPLLPFGVTPKRPGKPTADGF